MTTEPISAPVTDPGETPASEPAETPASEPSRPTWGRVASGSWWSLRLLLALFVFVGALQVMKTGAADLSVLNNEGFLVRNEGSTLGLGWLGALLVQSGSPVAATSLTLVEAGSIDEMEGFTMLTGSRLGAAFVVLLVAAVYALRGGEGKRMGPVSTAVMALSTTAVIYLPGAAIGWALLNWGPFKSLDLHFPAQFGDLIDTVYGGMLDRIESWPAVVLFMGGLGLLLLAFKLVDTVLPELNEEDLEGSRIAWLRKKWPMFGLGCLVALITLSVSVALTVLVPLVAKGYVKRDEIVPYIMGANITTLGDTLMVAFLLESAAAVRIVLAGIVGTAVVSLVILAFFYPQVRQGIWKFQRQMVKNRTRLVGFTAGLFLVPLSIIAISGVA